jgi:glutamate synthase domain-containing protein 3
LSVGARIAGRLAAVAGNAGLPPSAALRLKFRGTAGQSFGAFALPGMRLELEGAANDYVGKGLCGGEIVIRPLGKFADPVLVGNTTLYGATAGRLFVAGRAGDRFAVRNSGAVAVVEGAGDHGCEYMTGGTVVVLGRVGRNFGAGMSNGSAYVLDDDGTLAARCNPELVGVAQPDAEGLATLRILIREHAARTGSPRARALLRGWARHRERFRLVAPHALIAALQSVAGGRAAASR